MPVRIYRDNVFQLLQVHLIDIIYAKIGNIELIYEFTFLNFVWSNKFNLTTKHLIMKHSNSAIGLDKKKSTLLAKKLNTLLANYQLFYMNTRGFHWNITGDNFFELHLKFEEIYNNLQLKIDELAERVLTLGATPLHSYSDYLRESSIKEKINFKNGKSSLAEVIHSLEITISLQRELLSLSADASDEGTIALMSDYIREQEKMVWMYTAYLKKS